MRRMRVWEATSVPTRAASAPRMSAAAGKRSCCAILAGGARPGSTRISLSARGRICDGWKQMPCVSTAARWTAGYRAGTYGSPVRSN
jgi:hypothetical protein